MTKKSIDGKGLHSRVSITSEKRKYKAFFTAFYSSPVAKALIDLKTNRYVEVNNKFLKLFECTKSQVISKTAKEAGFVLKNRQTTKILDEYKKKQFNTFNFDVGTFSGKIRNVIITTEKITLSEKDYLLGYIIDNTERAAYEQRLADSEHKYSIVLNNTQNVIYEYSFKENKYSYISPSVKTLLGIPQEIFRKRKNSIITPLVKKPDRSKLQYHFNKIKTTKGKRKKDLYIEYRFSIAKDKYKWLADNHTVIYDHDGNPDMIIGNISDITPKKHAQDELLASYELQQKYLSQLTAIQDSIPANIALLDNNGNIIAVNKAWREFGINNGLVCSSDCIGMNYLKICSKVTGIDRKYALESVKGIREVLSGKLRVFNQEYPCHSPNEKRWFRLTVSPILSKNNSGVVVMHLDITGQKLAELNLIHSEEQYKVLFYSNPLPMWIFDFESMKILAVNDAAIKHYGYSESEFLDLKLTDFRPKREQEKYLKYREGIIKEKKQKRSFFAGIWKHRKKSGELIDVEITRTPLNFEGHEAVLILANDITERLRSEAVLIKRNSEISELYRAGRELSKTLNPDKMYNSIYKIIRKIMPCDSMVISGYDSNSNRISCKAAWIGRKRIDVSDFPDVPANFSGKGIQSRVIKSGKPELLLDFQKEVLRSKVKFYYKPDGSVNDKPNNKNLSERSAIIAPLKLKNRVIGVLQVKSLKEKAYTESDVKIIESLAAQIAVSTSNAVLYQQAQKEIRVRKETERELLKTSVEISNIYEISKDITGALTAEELNRKIFRVISSSFPECDIGISVLDEKKENIVLTGLFTNGKEMDTKVLPPIKFDRTGKGLQSSVLISNKTRIIENYREYIRRNGARFYVKDDGTISDQDDNSFDIAEAAMIIPLIYEKEAIGTLQLLNYSINGFTENALKVLESLASHIAVSIINAQLHSKLQNELHEKQLAEKELQAKTEELQILYDAQQVLSGSLDIESIYDNTYKIISAKIPCDSMIISAYNDSSKDIKILSVWADGVKPDINIFPLIPLAPEGRGIQSEVIRTGNSILIENYAEYYKKTVTALRYTNDKLIKESKPKYRSAIVVPMKHEGKTIGVIQLLSYTPKAYNLSNLKLLESLASPISAATFNASLYRQAQTEIAEKQKAREELALRNKEITLLYSAGRELLSTLDLQEIYDILYRKVTEVIDCESMIISEYNRQSEKIICKAAWVENSKHDPKNFPPLQIGKNYKGTQAESIISGTSMIVNNFSEVIENRDDKYYIDENGKVISYKESKGEIDPGDPVVNSAMYIPMKIGKNVIGVISVFSFRKNAYSEYDLKILESISVHLSVAAANAELYNRAQKEISERIKKEDELKQIRRHLENAQRIARLGSWMYDVKENKLYNSSELYRILGLKNEPEFFYFDEGMSHIHPEDKETTMAKIRYAIENKSSYENEDRIITPDGEIRNVKIVGEPVLDKDGNITALQGTLQDITDIKRINNELLKSLNEKELILKEIHHRVKNNLQIVSSLLRLQSDSISDKAAIGYLKMSEQRVKSMALIHQQLYRTKDLSRIDFREYLEDLCNYLFFAYDISFSRVALKVEVEDIYFGIDTALPCGLIVNELVTNSIKHAFPDYSIGTLTVKLSREVTGKYTLVIQDDGKGADVISFENNTTLGMELVKTLTEQLEGEISAESNNGTKITISFFDQNADQ
ncbi:MAG TPA: PAS domain S-box protein [Ignavibacteria bacterium]|nr:PAS domain S-box protein [Ignavibacteria bacterium]